MRRGPGSRGRQRAQRRGKGVSQGGGIPFDAYFWQLKRFFPGDPDFTYARYPELPYHYVIEAVKRGSKIYQHGLFDYERPIAQQTAILANQNRDPKKQKKGFTFEDFSFYIPRDERDLPDGAYGSAALAAISARLYPGWALFCYKDLVAGADTSYVPNEPILVAPDAILLHPVRSGAGWKGMLIAQESASEQQRRFEDSQGNVYTLTVPFIETKIVAVEDVTLMPR